MDYATDFDVPAVQAHVLPQLPRRPHVDIVDVRPGGQYRAFSVLSSFGYSKRSVNIAIRWRPENPPSSLCVKIRPPYLSESRVRTESAQPRISHLTCWLPEGCRASTDLRSPPDFPPDQTGKESCAAQRHPAGRTDDRICKLIDSHPTASRSGVIMEHIADLPIGSSRVENQTA